MQFRFGLYFCSVWKSSKGKKWEQQTKKDDWLSFDMLMKNDCKQKEHKPKIHCSRCKCDKSVIYGHAQPTLTNKIATMYFGVIQQQTRT